MTKIKKPQQKRHESRTGTVLDRDEFPILSFDAKKCPANVDLLHIFLGEMWN